MSAPLRLTPQQLSDLADALTQLSTIRVNTGVAIGAYGDHHVTVVDADVSLRLRWDNGEAQYVVDDRSGD